MEDLQIVEHIVRADPEVIKQCEISGIQKEDMHKVYCDRKSPFRLNSTRFDTDIRSMDNWLRSSLR